MNKKFFVWVVILIMAMPCSWAADKNVVVSIKPLHSLVQAVLGDTDTAYLLMPAANSPHHFYLRPSQVKALHNADVIFYLSDDFEIFLKATLASLPESVNAVAVVHTAQLDLLKPRSGGIWKESAASRQPSPQRTKHDDHNGHDDHNDHHDHNGHKDRDDHNDHDDHNGHHGHAHHAEHDMHVWLDPVRAQAMATAIAAALAESFPEQRSVYQANAEQLKQQLQQLHQQLQTTLTAIVDKPYIVFHDAYQYFEKRYQLSALGSIEATPGDLPSPQRLRNIRARIMEAQAQCVFNEPQFADDMTAQTIVEGTKIKIGTMDPLGVGIEAGPRAYFQLMHRLAASLRNCLM